MIWGLLFQPFGDSSLQECEHLLNVGERCLGVVVVIHEAVIVLFPIWSDFFNHKTRLLHRSATVLEVTTHFIGCFFQGAIETEGLRFRWANPVVGAVPFLRGVEYLLCALRNPHVVIGYGRSGVGIAGGAVLGRLRTQRCGHNQNSYGDQDARFKFHSVTLFCNHSQTSCDYRRHVFDQDDTVVGLEIATEGLLSFDGFKEGLEVALAEAAASLALDDLVEDRGAVFYRTSEDLEHVAFVVAVDQDA